MSSVAAAAVEGADILLTAVALKSGACRDDTHAPIPKYNVSIRLYII